MPRQVDADLRRDELAAAAARVIARGGLESATLREVAAEAGWTTGVVTHYFADKQQLLACTFEASLRRRRARRPASQAAPPFARLLAALEGALPVDEDRRRHWLVTIACCSQAVADEALADLQSAAYQEFHTYIAELVAEVRPSDLPAGGPDELAAQLIAAADGIAVQALFDPASWPIERQRRVLHQMLIHLGLPISTSDETSVTPGLDDRLQ